MLIPMNLHPRKYGIILLAIACCILSISVSSVLIGKRLHALLDSVEQDALKHILTSARIDREFSAAIAESAAYIVTTYPSNDARNAQIQRIKIQRGIVADLFTEYKSLASPTASLFALENPIIQSFAAMDEIVRLSEVGAERSGIVESFLSLKRIAEQEVRPAFEKHLTEISAALLDRLQNINSLLRAAKFIFGLAAAISIGLVAWLVVRLAKQPAL
ncbi:MAG: hypothetical protein Q8Q39_02790 [bacterium]|nr:hypothetical protein [bacterium]